MIRKKGLLIIPIIGFLTSSCARKGCTDPAALNYDYSAQKDNRKCVYGDVYQTLKEDIRTNYADIAFALYNDAYAEAVNLQIEIEAFIANPNKPALSKCRDAWKVAHDNYEYCEIFRNAFGPIDNSERIDLEINAWPINPSYIDYTTENIYSGIINDTINYPVITADLLQSAMRNGSNENVSFGFHVLEFILWGEDTAEAASLMPGDRSYFDFVDGDSASFNQFRRRAFLSEATTLTLNAIKQIKNEWDASLSGNYRSEFLSQDLDKSMKNVMRGLAVTLNEYVAEDNILVPMDLLGDAFEQSRFSDNSLSDIESALTGFVYIYEGKYTQTDGTKISGASLKELFDQVDIQLDSNIDSSRKSAQAYLNSISYPLDYQIIEEAATIDGPLESAAYYIKEIANGIVDAGAALEIKVVKTTN